MKLEWFLGVVVILAVMAGMTIFAVMQIAARPIAPCSEEPGAPAVVIWSVGEDLRVRPEASDGK